MATILHMWFLNASLNENYNILIQFLLGFAPKGQQVSIGSDNVWPWNLTDDLKKH